MNRVEYNRFVQSIEEKFQGNPQALQRKAGHYIFLSYLYIAGVILGALALLGGLIALIFYAPNGLTIKIGIVIGIAIFALIGSIIKGLNVKSEPPEGIQVTRKEAPELFALLDDLKMNVAKSKFDKVLVNGDFNAAVYQFPRLGMLGWYKSYLLLGLPLMQSISLDEFKAVLAHEFAHLSNKDGSSGNWIYRIRCSWDQIFNHLAESGNGGSWVLSPFVNWFWPRFNAHAFVLSRLHEYRADATAANYAGKEAASSALQRIEERARWIDEKIWPPIYELANEQPDPPGDPYHRIRSGARESVPYDQATEWLTQAFNRPTDYSDTHPALKDRLTSIGSVPAEITPIPPFQHSAAEMLFGIEGEERLITELNSQWTDSLSEVWKLRQEDVKKIREELGTEDEVKDAESAWKWADAMFNMEGAEAAIPWIDKTLHFDSDHRGARYIKGCYLVEKGKSEGVNLLDRLSKEDPELGMEALGMLKFYYSNLGDEKQVEAIEERADDFEKELQLAQEERNQIEKGDTFIPAELKEAELNHLQKAFQDIDHIKEIHVMKKQVTHFPRSPFYVFLITPKKKAQATDNLLSVTVNEISPLVEGAFYTFFTKQNKPVAKVIRESPGSLIYSREESDPDPDES